MLQCSLFYITPHKTWGFMQDSMKCRFWINYSNVNNVKKTKNFGLSSSKKLGLDIKIMSENRSVKSSRTTLFPEALLKNNTAWNFIAYGHNILKPCIPLSLVFSSRVLCSFFAYSWSISTVLYHPFPTPIPWSSFQQWIFPAPLPNRFAQLVPCFFHG